jgi:glucuronate isomerase
LWRRVACDWLAGLLVQGQIDDDEAFAMAHALSYGLAKEAYGL